MPEGYGIDLPCLLVIDAPAFALQELADLPVAVAAILFGQADHGHAGRPRPWGLPHSAGYCGQPREPGCG